MAFRTDGAIETGARSLAWARAGPFAQGSSLVADPGGATAQ